MKEIFLEAPNASQELILAKATACAKRIARRRHQGKVAPWEWKPAKRQTAYLLSDCDVHQLF